ncbi:MAG: preprotein translocase subunit SecY [Verrucomicrobiaceae bacterium]|nr:preprotein translocase subunit SecY [Verrucomicrobiaceae bacterium]
MISAFANSLKIPELRSRILYTLGMIVIVRLGAHITLPGVNPIVLDEWVKARAESSGGAAAVAALLNVFSGGGLQNCAIFALGIMPYISASIMLQLLTAVIPSLSKMAREEGGRQKINQYTRLGTIVLCVFQGYLLARSLQNPGQNIFLQGLATAIGKAGPLVPEFGFAFILTTVATITAGTLLMMWLGEQITERGIGNGISLLISVNIVSALPGALVQVWKTYVGQDGSPAKAFMLVLLFALLVAVIAGVIALTQAQRRIAIQYAKRVVGRKVYGGQTQYLPLKINYSGVMPIIFAQAILLFPSQLLSYMFPESGWVRQASAFMSSGWFYYSMSAFLIFFFSYFWVATMFQPTQISEDLKKGGGYLPGVRPGQPTADFLDFTMSRLTFAGAVFLTVIYLLPGVISGWAGIPSNAAQFFGGTSLLILVGVVLDVMKQLETHLLQANYDGFLRKGKIRGRNDRVQGATGKVADSTTIVWMWVGIAVVTLAGMVYYYITQGK